MIKILLRELGRFAVADTGATAIEYALIGSLLSIVIIASVIALNGSMVELYEYIRSFIVPVLEAS